jgi:hypothetical protein
VKFLRALVVVLLFGSVLLNGFLYYRTERLRPQMKINGTTVTRKEYHDWLEQHFGTDMMALIVKYNLVMQAAEKAGVSPSKAEIEEQLANYQELKPQAAALFKVMPWKKRDVEQDIEMNLALSNLTTKEVKASDSEIQQYFSGARFSFDRPTKLHAKVLKCADAGTAAKALQVVKQLVKPAGSGGYSVPELGQVASQYPMKAEAMFGDGAWVLWKPYNRVSNDPLIDRVSAMKPGEVTMFKVPNSNGLTLVVALEKVEQGRAAQLGDPDVRKRVERSFKMTRATPIQEIMRSLWDTAKIEVENDALKQTIERILLPERSTQERQASLTP